MAGRLGTAFAAIAVIAGSLFMGRPARGEVTAAQVNEAINQGVAFLEKRQRPDGRWVETTDAEPYGGTALITLALLSCGRTASDASVKKALDYLERVQDPERT